MCDIQSIQLAGQNFGSQGLPSSLEVVARVDCAAVNIEVRRNATDPTPLLSAANVTATPASQPVAGAPPNLVVRSFALTGGISVRCGEVLHVTVVCADDASCRRAEPARVQCKGFAGSECPTTVVLSVAPPLDQSADCVAAGAYVITVVDPVGTDLTYFWSSGAVGSPPAGLPGNGPSQTIQVQGGDPQKIVTVIAMKTGCSPAAGTVLVPAGDDVQCPTGFTVFVVQGATVVAGPHTNTQGVDWNVPAVPPATYTVRITSPAGAGESYEWFNNDGTLAATGPVNDHAVTVNAEQSTTISFRIKPSECCPAMLGSVKLTGTSSTSTTPPTGTPPAEEPPTQEPPEQPAVPSFCPLLRLIVGIALIVLLLGVVAAGCALVVAAAIPTMIAALIVGVIAAILLLLICRPSLCRLIGVLVWALKWAIVLGGLIAIGCGSLVSVFIVVLYGGVAAALIWWLISLGCRVPRMIDAP